MLSWEFPGQYVSRQFGFSDHRWIIWTKNAISNNWLLIVINCGHRLTVQGHFGFQGSQERRPHLLFGLAEESLVGVMHAI
ncbi:hypothetical protein AQUCO_06100048v1 [Aquilegia coerulea]|uniref:Uncharacterized protein n=1 Tax=Aquilegia coerulea TaxID=218851 RepID=A0A2G5CDC5_AQUCA|nr:hypothetical protein AQUCO_06100048v1 [Aquilegia coerulea]